MPMSGTSLGVRILRGNNISRKIQNPLVLGGSMLLMLVMGSVHAFSVFLLPIEKSFAASRTASSFTYSLALVVLTVFVLFGHHVFKRLKPARLVLTVGAVSSLGALLAGVADHLVLVWVGYGVLFGAANGLGYAFCLQFAGQSNQAFRGGAMGLVTAAYGLGAAVAPLPFQSLIDEYGLQGGMIGLSATLMVVAPVVAYLFARSRCRLELQEQKANNETGFSPGTVGRLWLAYATAVFAGLMVIGHATGIVQSAGLDSRFLYVAPMAIALANVCGSISGGYFVDIIDARRILVFVASFSTLSLLFLAYSGTPILSVIGLSVIGFSYGATISAFPAAISRAFGAVAGIRIYGRVFTAWGTAGLCGPWIAGILFESTGGYFDTLLIAAAFGLASIVAIRRMPV